MPVLAGMERYTKAALRTGPLNTTQRRGLRKVRRPPRIPMSNTMARHTGSLARHSRSTPQAFLTTLQSQPLRSRCMLMPKVTGITTEATLYAWYRIRPPPRRLSRMGTMTRLARLIIRQRGRAAQASRDFKSELQTTREQQAILFLRSPTRPEAARPLLLPPRATCTVIIWEE